MAERSSTYSASRCARQVVAHTGSLRRSTATVRSTFALFVGGAILLSLCVWALGTGSARAQFSPVVDRNAAGNGITGTTPSPSPTCIAPGTYRFLLAYADTATPPTTLRTNLLAQSSVGAVDLFDANAGTPTLAQLQQYQVVFTFSNNVYADPTTLGDNLADYQDGGGIVIASFGSFYNAGSG